MPRAALGRGEPDVSEAQGHLHVCLQYAYCRQRRCGLARRFVNMLANMDDPKSIGLMAVALLTLFYGAIIAELFVGPLINRLKGRVSDAASLTSSLKPTVVTYAAVPAILLSFFVLLLSFKG